MESLYIIDLQLLVHYHQSQLFERLKSAEHRAPCRKTWSTIWQIIISELKCWYSDCWMPSAASENPARKKRSTWQSCEIELYNRNINSSPSITLQWGQNNSKFGLKWEVLSSTLPKANWESFEFSPAAFSLKFTTALEAVNRCSENARQTKSAKSVTKQRTGSERSEFWPSDRLWCFPCLGVINQSPKNFMDKNCSWKPMFVGILHFSLLLLFEHKKKRSSWLGFLDSLPVPTPRCQNAQVTKCHGAGQVITPEPLEDTLHYQAGWRLRSTFSFHLPFS